MGMQAGHRAVFRPQRRHSRREHLEQHSGRGRGGGAGTALPRRENGVGIEQADVTRQGICEHGTLFPIV